MSKLNSEDNHHIDLRSLNIFDTPRVESYNNICSLLAQICEIPTALVSLLDVASNQFFLQEPLLPAHVPEQYSFCHQTTKQTGIFEVTDAHKHPVLKNSPLVTEAPYICFYAGAPLITKSGQILGTLCLIDKQPQKLNQQQKQAFLLLAEQVVSMVVLHEQQDEIVRLNAALNEKINLLDKITQNMPTMVAYWDVNHVCHFANQSYLKAMNKAEREVIGQHYDLVLPFNILKYAKQFLTRAFNGEASTCEFNPDNIGFDNNIYQAQYIPDFDGNDNIVGVLVLVTDITKTRLIEENTRLFSRIIEHSSDAILITDSKFSIETVNPSFEEASQYDIHSIIGKTADILFTHNEQKLSFQNIQQLLKDNDTWVGEMWLAKKNGALFHVLTAIDVIKNEYQQISHYCFSMRDLTESEKLRKDLIDKTNMLNRTGKMAKVGGWELNILTSKILWTDEVFRIHELPSSAEPPLEEALSFYPLEARPILEAALDSCIKSGKPYDLELPFVTAKNKHIWVRATCESVTLNGEPIKLTGTFQDITERKLAEIQRQKDELKHRSYLVREVHHRIKNNLQGVSGILSNFAHQNPSHAEAFNEANAQLQSVAVIYGLQGQEPDTSIEVGELMFAIKGIIERLWQTDITFDLPSHWTAAYLNKNESVPIALILNELLTNAAKHQSNDNSVTISLKHIASNQIESTLTNKITLSISNDGNYLLESESNQAQSGLALMSALMPKSGASLHWDIGDTTVKAMLDLRYPVINFEKSAQPE